MPFIFWLLLFISPSIGANPIDDKCPSFVYGKAPVVTADQYICYRQFGVAYSYVTKTPIYTVEYLEAGDTGDEPRSDDFRPDTSVPHKYSATLADYRGSTTECFGEPCDRGHLTPNQDFSSCAICASESFYLTNMVPQNAKNNRIIWKYLETKTRKYVAKVTPVYVITGTVYTSNPIRTIGNGVAIPDRLFKVVINPKTNESISFLMDNKYYPVSDLNGKVVNLETLEMTTGIIFPDMLNKQKRASYQEWFSGLK